MNKMSNKDFLAKIENEGVDYAFLEYGLSEKNINEEENPEFFELVKIIAEKYNDLKPYIDELNSYVDDMEEM